MSLTSQLNIDTLSTVHPSHLISWMRSSFITVKYHYKNATPTEISHIVIEFEKLLKLIAQQNDIDLFISTLNMFASTKHLETCKSLIIDVANIIDVNAWMKSIINHIGQMNSNNVKSNSTDKDFILSLTRSILVFGSLEAELCTDVPTFENTKYFMDECIKLNIIARNKQFGSQYLKCFEIIKKFLNTFACCDSNEWIKEIGELTLDLQ